ncbi:hypothetical protein JCM10599A_38590 [Paraburkholderia kururiensis]
MDTPDSSIDSRMNPAKREETKAAAPEKVHTADSDEGDHRHVRIVQRHDDARPTRDYRDAKMRHTAGV